MNFSDAIEQASALEEMEREYALARVRSSMGRGLRPIRRCHFCDDVDLPREALFCDKECRDMWQQEQDARRRNGGL